MSDQDKLNEIFKNPKPQTDAPGLGKTLKELMIQFGIMSPPPPDPQQIPWAKGGAPGEVNPNMKKR